MLPSTNTDVIDVGANRKTKSYSNHELTLRVIWGLLRPFFRYSPRIAFKWRSFLLRQLGAQVGKHVHIYNTATIYYPWNLAIGDYASIGEHAYIYNLGKISIGARATISYRAHLCAGSHDYQDLAFALLRPEITIDDDAWVCTDAFVGPGVRVRRGAVVGARAVAVKDVEEFSIVGGNPARLIGSRPPIQS